MPARFTNVSNSGRARFTNVSNSGRAVFGGGGAGPATTSTTTTTTTIAYNTFSITVSATIQCVTTGDAFVVRSSNLSDVSLADASTNGSALYKMPQNTLLTGYSYIKSDVDGAFFINSSTGVVGAPNTNC